jgi:hypothetical protein
MNNPESTADTQADFKARLVEAAASKSSDDIALEGRAEISQGSLALLLQARRKILIFSHQLAAWCYNRPEVEEAIKDLAIRVPNPSCFILLQDNAKVIEEGHRLLHLSRRLTSKIQIQRPLRQDHLDHYQNFLLVDDSCVLLQPIHSRPKARLSFHNPALVRELNAFFQDVWAESEPDSQLRELHI